MNKLYISIIAFFVLISTYLYLKNNNLENVIENQNLVIKNNQASMEQNKKVYQLKLQAITEKEKNNQKILKTIDDKRKRCENDEKAISIINVGVPECLFKD